MCHDICYQWHYSMHLKWLKAANLSNQCIRVLGIIFFDNTSCRCAGMMAEVTWGYQGLWCGILILACMQFRFIIFTVEATLSLKYSFN